MRRQGPQLRLHGGRRPFQRWSASVLVVLASCTGGSSPPSQRSSLAPLPVGVPTVDIAMLDYRFEFDPPREPGRVVFRVRNAGKVPHHLFLFPLPEDLPPIDVQLRGEKRRLLEPFAAIYDRSPGDIGTFAVDLKADQRYALVCSVVPGDEEPHWKKGMASEFRIPPDPAARS